MRETQNSAAGSHLGQGDDVPCSLKSRTKTPEKNPGDSIFDDFIVTSILAVGDLK